MDSQAGGVFASQAVLEGSGCPPPTEAPGAASVQTSVEIKPSSKWQDECWNGKRKFPQKELGQGHMSLEFGMLLNVTNLSQLNKISIYASWYVQRHNKSGVICVNAHYLTWKSQDKVKAACLEITKWWAIWMVVMAMYGSPGAIEFRIFLLTGFMWLGSWSQPILLSRRAFRAKIKG